MIKDQILIYSTPGSMNVVIEGMQYTKEMSPIQMIRLANKIIEHALEEINYGERDRNSNA